MNNKTINDDSNKILHELVMLHVKIVEVLHKVNLENFDFEKQHIIGLVNMYIGTCEKQLNEMEAWNYMHVLERSFVFNGLRSKNQEQSIICDQMTALLSCEMMRIGE